MLSDLRPSFLLRFCVSCVIGPVARLLWGSRGRPLSRTHHSGCVFVGVCLCARACVRACARVCACARAWRVRVRLWVRARVRVRTVVVVVGLL